MLHEFSEGVKNLLRCKSGKEAQFINEFSSKLYTEGIPIVFHIKISEITGKERVS